MKKSWHLIVIALLFLSTFSAAISDTVVVQNDFDFGLPEKSIADSKYVGERALVEAMISANDWIAGNSE